MAKRIQINLNDESSKIVKDVTKEANQNYFDGRITYSDVINEMILNSKLDLKELRLKYVSLRKSLLFLSKIEDIDPELVIKKMSELKSRNFQKTSRKLTQRKQEQHHE